MNIIHSENGQSQIQRAQSNPKGQYTGERIPGAKYRAIVDLAAQGRQIDRIAREAGVTRRTAKAVVERESRQIAERKQELLEQSLRIARRAANQIEAKINDKARLSELVPVFGVAVDKIAALSSDTLTQTQQNLHLHLQSYDVARGFNEFLAQLRAERGLTSLPDDNAQSLTLTPNVSGDGPPCRADRQDDAATRITRSLKRREPREALQTALQTGLRGKKSPRKKRANGKRRDIGERRLTNTWQIDCHFVRFDAARCAFDEITYFRR